MTSENRIIASSAAIHRPALDSLRDWDMNTLDPRPSARPIRRITPTDARLLAGRLRDEYPEDTMAGVARGDAPDRIVETIYQGFDGIDLYPTVEEKAAHLLYFTVKDHPYVVGTSGWDCFGSPRSSKRTNGPPCRRMRRWPRSPCWSHVATRRIRIG